MAVVNMCNYLPFIQVHNKVVLSRPHVTLHKNYNKIITRIQNRHVNKLITRVPRKTRDEDFHLEANQ